MDFAGNTPPSKKRRLMPLQSMTDIVQTPSPPTTPSACGNEHGTTDTVFASPSSTLQVHHHHNHNHNSNGSKIPHVNSTPIKNYFARFSERTDKQCTKQIQYLTPRTLRWTKSAQTIPFPPSSSSRWPDVSIPSSPLNRHIQLNTNKFDAYYHPLPNIIDNRIDLNVFSDSYFKRGKKVHDDVPFLDPMLQTTMRDDALRLLCDIHDHHHQQAQMETNTKPKKQDQDSDQEHQQDAASDAEAETQAFLNNYGDVAITKMLQGVMSEDKQFKLGESPIRRAQQLMEYLRCKQPNGSYEQLREGVVYLSGVLEFITTSLLESAGDIAKWHHSVTESTETSSHSKQIRKHMDKNASLLCKYDEDVFSHDINRDMFMIRPLHIRDCIQADNQLFWLQQAVINNELRLCDTQSATKANGKNDIERRLNTDCVGHICSFFQGDLPMLSSLARVNTKFYVMTGSNYLWKPIALRCLLFNPHIVALIEDNDNCDNGIIANNTNSNKQQKNDGEARGYEDFRSYISFSRQVKFSVLRERWMRQRIRNDAFELYVRINPVYTDLQERFYQLLYDAECNRHDIDLIVDTEMYDLFGRLLQIFADRDEFLTVSDIIRNAKCLNFDAARYRLLREVFGARRKRKKNTSKAERDDDDDDDDDGQRDDEDDTLSVLEKVMQIERENMIGDEQGVLFVEVPFSQNCLDCDDEQDEDAMGRDDRRLWIGRHLVIFAQLSSVHVRSLHNHRMSRK